MAKRDPNIRQKWQERIEQSENSGKSLREWCLEHNVNYSTFSYWKYRLRKEDHPALHISLNQKSFFELQDSSTKTGVTVEQGGTLVHLAKNFDPETLQSCLQLLRGLQC